MANFRYNPTLSDKTTERAAYMKKLEQMPGVKQRWCKSHPTSKWAPGFKQCAQGYMRNEKCEEGE